MMNTQTTSSAAVMELKEDKPFFRVVKEIPRGLTVELQLAVMDFIKASHVPKGVDLNGFYHQTLQAMAAATVLNQGGELWIGTANGHLCTYILASIGQNIDSKLSYTVTQAWVRKDQRGKPWVKWAWEQLRQRAKDTFCGHLVILSSRGNDKAYCRFLGKGFHFYVSMLKEEL